MDIRPAQAGPVATTTVPQNPPTIREFKPDVHGVADVYNSSRWIGNYASGAVVNAATEEVSSIAQSPKLEWKIVSNLWKAETLGPNIKTIGTLASLPATALSLVAAPVVGAVLGITRVASASYNLDNGPLEKDASTAVAREITGTTNGGHPENLTGSLIKQLDELGTRKLEPGQKPFDVPLLSPAFAVVGGALSGAIGGTVGLVAGLGAGAISGGKEVFSAVTSRDMSFGQRLGKIATAPLNLMVGPALAWKSIKEAVPRGLSDGWHYGLVKPVVDTARISSTLGESVIQEAWEK